ncbi:hypothetical protein L873DRAFT_1395873 [Choiromyces venosus 120613-1]|uniref:Uncharacterized protein n=1 Tax=Choiromyces venosus 120613-1 TaxID=1336337 RepID=A0A3N4JEC9_9PEZI|nr:hypothetical protein L873DRAFT_1395873 [Choiromyces venosus 120613-1]
MAGDRRGRRLVFGVCRIIQIARAHSPSGPWPVGRRESGHLKRDGLWPIVCLVLPARRTDGTIGNTARARDTGPLPAMAVPSGRPTSGCQSRVLLSLHLEPLCVLVSHRRHPQPEAICNCS